MHRSRATLLVVLASLAWPRGLSSTMNSFQFARWARARIADVTKDYVVWSSADKRRKRGGKLRLGNLSLCGIMLVRLRVKSTGQFFGDQAMLVETWSVNQGTSKSHSTKVFPFLKKILQGLVCWSGWS